MTHKGVGLQCILYIGQAGDTLSSRLGSTYPLVLLFQSAAQCFGAANSNDYTTITAQMFHTRGITIFPHIISQQLGCLVGHHFISNSCISFTLYNFPNAIILYAILHSTPTSISTMLPMA